MRTSIRLLAVLCIVLATLIGEARDLSGSRQANTGGQKPDLLATAREALGGARSANVAKLVIDAECQMLGGGRVLSIDPLNIEIAPPKRFIRRQDRQSPPAFERQGFDGDTYINEAKSRDPNMTVGFRTPTEAERQTRLRSYRERATAYLVASMLSERSPIPMQYQPRGRAKSPDGEADILEARSADGFVVTVFLDLETHRPLMAEYSESLGNRLSMATLYLSDYRKAQGVWFPHEWRISRGGTPIEMWRVSRVQLTWDK